MLFLVLLSLFIQETFSIGDWIFVSNKGRWGILGNMERCPKGTSARGFSLKVEWPIDGDDTALNGIKLHCNYPKRTDENLYITSTVGDWGNGWGAVLWCPKGNLISFSLKVEKPQGDGDDTAANSIKMKCSDGTILTGIGGPWGDYGGWSGECPKGICGILTQVEGRQGRGDDTALNNVIFECCS